MAMCCLLTLDLFVKKKQSNRDLIYHYKTNSWFISTLYVIKDIDNHVSKNVMVVILQSVAIIHLDKAVLECVDTARRTNNVIV